MGEIKLIDMVILLWLVCGGLVASMLSILDLRIMTVWLIGFALIPMINYHYLQLIDLISKYNNKTKVV